MRERKEGKGEGWRGIVGKEKFLYDRLWRRLKKYLRTQLLVYIINNKVIAIIFSQHYLTIKLLLICMQTDHLDVVIKGI